MTTRGRTWILAGCFLAASTCGLADEAPLTRFEFSQPHMGTQFRIVLYAPDATLARRATDDAFERIARLDDTMTDYRADSELMSLCHQAGGPPVAVSEDLFRVLEKSQELARRSRGAFDITAAPLIHLWRRARRRHELPDPKEMAEARRRVGYKLLRLDPKARTAQLLKPGMLLDLGGIAKGYAADEALKVLARHAITRALVAAGGDIAVGAPPPGAPGWRVGIAPLESPDQPPTRFLLLHDAGVSTSGDAEQHVEIGGVRYSHIIDPRNGRALIGRSSTTVVAPDATTSDSLATALSVLGPKGARPFLRAYPKASALIARQTGRGTQTFEYGVGLSEVGQNARE
ncbi:MAG: FAD:protein FMN transferase [Terriglobia bacterium]